MASSRKIAFRAWDKKRNRWLPNFQIKPNGAVQYQLPSDESPERLLWQDVDNVELVEYTGLHDKNGVEIYEGDIVRVGWSKEWYGTDIAEVKFGKGEVFDGCCAHQLMFGWFVQSPGLLEHQKIYDGGLKAEHLIPESDHYEVIGNIYENPKLI